MYRQRKAGEKVGSELSQAVVVALSDTDPAVPSPDRFIATIADESTHTLVLLAAEAPQRPNEDNGDGWLYDQRKWASRFWGHGIHRGRFSSFSRPKMNIS